MQLLALHTDAHGGGGGALCDGGGGGGLWSAGGGAFTRGGALSPTQIQSALERSMLMLALCATSSVARQIQAAHASPSALSIQYFRLRGSALRLISLSRAQGGSSTSVAHVLGAAADEAATAAPSQAVAARALAAEMQQYPPRRPRSTSRAGGPPVHCTGPLTSCISRRCLWSE